MNIFARLLLLFAALFQAGAVLAVGEIVFITGNVSITSQSGGIRIPARGERVKEGDVLATGKNGEIQLHMDDDGLIAVRPDTRLKIEVYRAHGVESDRVELRLYAGSLRSISGWIGRNYPSHVLIHTISGDIQLLKGCDHEPMVQREGAGAGVYDKVNCGAVEIEAPGGKLEVSAGNVGHAPDGERPILLPALPARYAGSEHDKMLGESAAALDKTWEKHFLDQRRASERNGLDKEGKPRIANFQDASQALQSLEEIFRAYETGNINFIRNKLDPSLIGFQKFLDDMVQDTTLCKQMRINLLDTQVQAGPDLAIIQTTWEKRCILLPGFVPVLISGHGSFFVHKGTHGWYLAQTSSGNQPACSTAGSTVSCTTSGSPFTTGTDRLARTYAGAAGGTSGTPVGTGGHLATLSANGPAFTNCALISSATLPTPVGAAIVVTDADLAGTASVQVAVSNSQGERETITLVASAPGSSQFVLPGGQLSIARRLPIGGNGVLEQQPVGGVCVPWTITYYDSLTPSGPQDVFVVVGP